MDLGRGDTGEKVDLRESAGNGKWLPAANSLGATKQRLEDAGPRATRLLRTAVARIVRTRPATHHGWAVTGTCTSSGAGTGGGHSILDVPVVGDLDSVAKVAGNGRYHVVSIAQTPGGTSRRPLDILITWKTMGAVRGGEDAY